MRLVVLVPGGFEGDISAWRYVETSQLRGGRSNTRVMHDSLWVRTQRLVLATIRAPVFRVTSVRLTRILKCGGADTSLNSLNPGHPDACKMPDLSLDPSFASHAMFLFTPVRTSLWRCELWSPPGRAAPIPSPPADHSLARTLAMASKSQGIPLKQHRPRSHEMSPLPG